MIGDIMTQIQSSPTLRNNTVVVFASDNGAWLDPGSGLATSKNPLTGGCNAPFRGGKGSTWEGGVRVPGVVWYPSQVPAGSTLRDAVSFIDVLPTLADFTGTSLPKDVTMDGVSVAAALRQTDPEKTRKTLGSRPLFFWREAALYAMRLGPHKLHWHTRKGFSMTDRGEMHDPPLVFNVETDPAESLPLEPDGDEYKSAVAKMLPLADKQRTEMAAAMAAAPSAYEAQDWHLVPCCHTNRTAFDLKFAIKLAEAGKWGMALWDECVCE